MNKTPWHLQAPAFAEIEQAAARIRDVLRETPLLESERLNRRLGGRLLVKAEGLQHTGSFKARGAWNRLSLLDPAERDRGVLTFSSGNHGQAVAWAAQRQGVRRTVVVMPADAPARKIEATRGWGAEVRLYDRHREDREAIGRAFAEEEGLVLVPPYDDRRVVAGAGTLGLEVARQAERMGLKPDRMLLSCSGGGLSAGCALAWETLLPAAKVWAVEPEAFDDTARSIAAGKRLANRPEARSLCDSVLAQMPGVLTFPINAPRLGGVAVVSDNAALEAMGVAFAEFGLVAEPGGALPLAAVLADKVEIADRCTILVLSGANVDPDVFAKALIG